MKPALFVLMFALPLGAQVKFTKSADKIDIAINGGPFSTFYFAGEAPKPYLAPLRAADGTQITRPLTMENAPGTTRDHPHHRGLWFTYGDINKIDFWMNEPGNKGRHGTVKLDKLQKVKDGKKTGVIQASFVWSSDTGTPLIEEQRKMTFHADKTLRIVDFDVTLTALDKAVFGDTKEGFFAIRLADKLAEKGGTGKMTSAEGKTGMKEIWGKSSPWVDYAGTLEGKPVGVAIMDHPSSFRYPTYWHARDYGLFAANAFGLHDFTRDKTKDGSHPLEKGQSIHFRYRVVIHPGDTESAGIAKMFESWSKTK
jgi:hypothetical protein